MGNCVSLSSSENSTYHDGDGGGKLKQMGMP